MRLMVNAIHRMALPAMVLMASSATASDPAVREAQQLALYRAHAGEPVDSVRYYGRMQQWTPLGDSALTLWTSPGRAYLLELDGRCNGLDFAQAIELTHDTSHIYARFDKVLVHDRGLPGVPCGIRSIRPVDVAAYRQARRAAGER